MITKKSDGSQVKEKESTDSSTTIEDDDVKGKSKLRFFSQSMIEFTLRGRKEKEKSSKLFPSPARCNYLKGTSVPRRKIKKI